MLLGAAIALGAVTTSLTIQRASAIVEEMENFRRRERAARFGPPDP